MIDSPTDKTLMELLVSGDEQAFDQLYARYKNSLFFFLNANCSDQRTVNDVYQDTWETVFRSAHQYKDSGQFKAWLLRIARSRLVDYYRKSANKPVHNQYEESSVQLPQTDSVSTETLAELFCQTEQLLKILESLPGEQQEALSLYAVGLSINEIAEITGVKKETAKSRVRYARARLIQQMQDSP